MELRLKPFKAKGELLVQPSKSDAHRKIICAAFSKGLSSVDNVVMSDDITATVESMRILGVKIKTMASSSYRGRNEIFIGNIPETSGETHVIDCGESGSTLRFLSMIVPALGLDCIFKGKGRLPERPMGHAIEFYERYGILFDKPKDAFLPLRVSGKLEGPEFRIDSSVSSQFISGLMMGIAAASMEAKLEATGTFESRGYAELTAGVLREYGVDVMGQNPYIIRASEGLRPGRHVVEGDWSNASYFIAMNRLGGSIGLTGLSEDSLQPDSAISDCLDNIGGEIDVSEFPDLMPTVAAVAAAKPVITTITGKRLRYKESDRISAMCKGLLNLGIEVSELDDGLRIKGSTRIPGGTVESYNDHRIAMALAVLACVSKGDIIIKGAECTEKSYPDFFSDLCKVGGVIA